MLKFHFSTPDPERRNDINCVTRKKINMMFRVFNNFRAFVFLFL